MDVAVVGLGAMGSAALYHLAKRGLRVVGFDRYTPPHKHGSSHGRTRAIRQAYYEHPDYVPLIRRAWQLWRELEGETGRRLLVQTGAYMIGAADSDVVRGSAESARVHGLPHRMLTAEELRREASALRPSADEVALREERAGVLFVEECIEAHLERAKALGAEVRFGVEVREPPASRSVLTAGPWMGEFLQLPLKVERQVAYWLDTPAPSPLFLWERGPRTFYSLPDVRGDGVKIAFHHGGELTSAQDVHREVSPAETEEMRRLVDEFAPGLAGPVRASSTCLYTNTPDGHFAVGRRGGWVFASACSGHGFKFAPVIGEILADLVLDGGTRHSIGLFDSGRFGS